MFSFTTNFHTMKSNPILFLVLTMTLSVMKAHAQQDTITVSYSEEPAEKSSFSFKEKYKYWTRATVEEKSMFKVGLSQLAFGFGGGANTDFSVGHVIAFERKVGVPFSLLVQYRNDISTWTPTMLGLDAGVRYYYALPTRIKRGKSANNFSANYFSLQYNNTWSIGDYSEGVTPVRYDFTTFYSRDISLLYGLQRRLGKYGYVDINIGYGRRIGEIQSTNLRRGFFDFNFSIGAAF